MRCDYCGSNGECFDGCGCAKCTNPENYEDFKKNNPEEYEKWIEKKLESDDNE